MNGDSMKCCAVCRKCEQLLLCGACQNVRYCSKSHQKQHWPIHKSHCSSNTRSTPLKTDKHDKTSSKSLTKLQILSSLENKVAKLDINELKMNSKRNNINDTVNDGGIMTSMPVDQYAMYPPNNTRRTKNSLIKDKLSLQGENELPVSVERKLSNSSDPDLSTPIDNTEGSKLCNNDHPISETPSLYQLDPCRDTSRLADCGFSPEWFDKVTKLVVGDMNKFGVCVIDNFLGTGRATHVLREVTELHDKGLFRDGQVVSRTVRGKTRGMIRGDKTTWVTGQEPECSHISQLISIVDSVVDQSNKDVCAGQLAKYDVRLRTRAMVACYPGDGTHYVKHVDNPNGDGRCITAIYYVNDDWSETKGGMLKIYPEAMNNQMIQIDPIFDRMLFFWSDRRTPHEVLPAYETRFAITVWYLDQKEREIYQDRMQVHDVQST